MVQSSKLIRLYIWIVSLSGIAVFCLCLNTVSHNRVNIPELLLFSLLVFIAELIPTKIPNTDLEMAMTMPLAINLFLSNGIEAMVIFASVPMLLASFYVQRHRPKKILFSFAVFNVADFILSATVASMIYYIIGGQTFLEYGSNLSIKAIILPLALWTIIYNITNAMLSAIGSGMYSPQAWKVLLIKGLQYNIPNFVFSIPFSILFVSLYVYGGWLGILLLIIPLFTGRHAANLYSKSVDAYIDTITSLGSFMQHYHPYTRGHQERVAEFADMLAKEMRLPIQSLMYIKDAGLLHDIGKVGVDYSVLDKVEKLSEEDWALVKKHPGRSADIVAQMRYLDRIVPWIRYHHERPDGTGYPESLTAESIPLESSILAVADAFDAMTGGLKGENRRTYREPLSIDKALDQLRKGKGTQFHPVAADTFINMITRIVENSNE